MEIYEFNTHPFIVKVWLEETSEEAGKATWRGHITHVPSGKRQHFQDLDEVPDFIWPYLERLGAKFSPFDRLSRLLRRIISSFRALISHRRGLN